MSTMPDTPPLPPRPEVWNGASDWDAIHGDPDPACPGCGMRSQVEPSRSEPGRYMCHGCARVFDTPTPTTEPGA